ncbi:MAG: polysaccharide deacetylase family protein [Candidatus Eisenbacteria bacterium]|uniref:Polysaccharide deacetylase family protein n=1 Tax=Eiseniibacteriota bacterium TaxID=2212470 RepID=A0A849SRP8_UNCEI|nr:polysaccharide deacetylase family protein [Candidatus Eisenbacteria bacterium]
MSARTVRWLLSLAHAPRGAGGRGSLTILRHHRVYDDRERPLYRLGVSAWVLRDQLRFLAAERLTPITVGEGLAHLAGGGAGHRVALSFDDGYRDNVERALPLLAETGARATFFLTAGLMEERQPAWWDVLDHALATTRSRELRWAPSGAPRVWPLGGLAERSAALHALLPAFRTSLAERDRRLASLRQALEVTAAAPCEFATWDEARAFAAAGMEVGAHTLHHPHLSVLEAADQHHEIAASKQQVEARLGVSVAGLAYPGGDHDDVTVAACRASGLTYAVTTRAGDVVAPFDPFRISRRGFSEGACLGPGGRFSRRLARAELDGAFDRLRATAREVAS